MKILIAAAIALCTSAALAQHHQHKQGSSPYSGIHSRAVKALSDQQIADLRAGRGMGQALAAELNGYPGPMHVLALADHLGLTSEQRRAVQQLFDAMKAEAIALGERVIDGETSLDRAFRDRSITPERLAELSAAIGKSQAELRAVHLKYHLTTAELLGPDQVRRYSELRGYR
jgi:Heavy-metal resistance